MFQRLLRSTMFAALVLGLSAFTFGQAGVSSMSSSALRSGVILKHEDIRVEELINYHRHQIPLPAWDDRINVDTRWGQLDGKAVFQIGLATHRDIVEEFRVPLNLVLVIDRSGSMNGDRMRQVKKSLRDLASKFAPDDLVSIVTYSDDAEICLEATRVKNLAVVEAAIANIEAGGSTNLHAGLMLGYQVAQQQFDKKRANRVILLTDGIANRGVTNEQEIARQSKTFNDNGIGLSTIGLGDNFNRSLLRELADAGKGALHFIADASDIQKVFVDEFDSLLSPAAQDLTLTIRVPDGAKLPKIYGYQPEKDGSSYSIPLENMSYGATQVVIGQFASREAVVLDVELSFFDRCTSRKVSVRKTIETGSKKNADRVLKKNYAIAKVSHSVRQAAKLIEAGKYDKATKRLKSATRFARVHFSAEVDSDVDRVCKIAMQQRTSIEQYVVVQRTEQ